MEERASGAGVLRNDPLGVTARSRAEVPIAGKTHPRPRAWKSHPFSVMGQPAAREDDDVVGVDTHIVMIPSPAGPVPTPLPSPFTGKLSAALSATIVIDDRAAAVKGSAADNRPAHVPAGGPFQRPPLDRAVVDQGAITVLAEGKPLARHGDVAMTCNDPADQPNGTILVTGCTVIVGD